MNFFICLFPTILILFSCATVTFAAPQKHSDHINNEIVICDPLSAKIELEKQLDRARYYEKNGEYQKALERYLFVFDKSRPFPEFDNIRIALILLKISTMGDQFPPAREAIEIRRNNLAYLIKEGKADRRDINEFSEMNDELNESQKTMELYFEIKEAHQIPKILQERFASVVWEKLVIQKKYKDLVGIARILANIEAFLIAEYEVSSTFPYGKKAEDPRYMQGLKEKINKEVFLVYEALIAIKNDKVANNLKRWILRFRDDSETYEILIKAAMNAGRADLIEFLKKEKSLLAID